MKIRLKTNANKDKVFEPIPGDLPLQYESCLMSFYVSETMGCIACKFAPKRQRNETATAPLWHGCLCHVGLGFEGRYQRFHKIQCQGPVIPFTLPSPPPAISQPSLFLETREQTLKGGKKMKQYALIGAYNPKDSKSNLKFIHMSDNINELKTIWKTIDRFYSEMGETFDGGLSEKALKMVEDNGYLNDTFELFHETVLWTLDIIGIFQAVEINPGQKEVG
jgi:hypothetical protein